MTKNFTSDVAYQPGGARSDSVLVGLGCGLRFCISHKPPYDANSADRNGLDARMNRRGFGKSMEVSFWKWHL